MMFRITSFTMGLLFLALTPLLAGAQEPAPAETPAPVDIRQVQVQVWISETGERGLRELGANLHYTRYVREEEQNGSVQQVSTNVFDPVNDFGRVTLPTPTSDPPNPPYKPVSDNPDFTAPLRPDESGAAGLQTRSGFGMTYNVINAGYGTVDMVFRSLETQTDLDLISKPELLVLNTGVAEIKAGGQVPYQDVQYPKGVPQLAVKWRDVGVSMKLQPTIMPNDFIQLHLQQLEVTDIARIENLRGVDLPVFTKRSQTGFVLVPNGQTVAIGGLSSKVVRRTERRVPIVGSIPILGMPFRHRVSEADVVHLIVFVSPTIVDLRNLSEEGTSALNFWRERGSEWAHADEVESEITAHQDEL